MVYENSFFRQCLAGHEPGNRWCDKINNMIATRNGLLGGHCEHSPCEGVIPGMMCQFATVENYKKKQNSKENYQDKTVLEVFSFPEPQELTIDFGTNYEMFKEAIANVTKEVAEKHRDFGVYFHEYENKAENE